MKSYNFEICKQEPSQNNPFIVKVEAESLKEAFAIATYNLLYGYRVLLDRLPQSYLIKSKEHPELSIKLQIKGR